MASDEQEVIGAADLEEDAGGTDAKAAAPSLADRQPDDNNPAEATAHLSMLERVPEAWSAVVDRFRHDYVQGILAASASHDATGIVLSLDAPLGSSSRRYEAVLDRDNSRWRDFSPFHCDSLLNEMSDLLDRFRSTERERAELSAKAAQVALDVLEYLESENILRQEIEAGLFDTAYKTSLYRWNADKILEDLAAANTQSFDSFKFLYSQTYFDRVSSAHQRAAVMSVKAAYEQPETGGERTYTWNNQAPLTVAGHLKAAASETTMWAFTKENRYFNKDLRTFRRTAEALQQQRKASGRQARWDQDQIDIRMRKVELARKLGDFKIRLATERGGAFNYAEQVRECDERLARDAREILSRAAAVAIGLRMLFGIQLPLPQGSMALFSDADRAQLEAQGVTAAKEGGEDGDLSLTDQTTLWCLDATAELVKFGHRDQRDMMTVSLRNSVADWEKALETGRWEVPVDETDFDGQRHVRLRGISLEIVAAKADGFWRARVNPPHISYVRHMDDQKIELDQSFAATCRLGRISSPDAPREPQVVGIASLRNISPLGQWSVELTTEHSTTGETREAIADVLLTLHVAYVSA